MTSTYRPLLDELGLTYTQYLVMLVLWETDVVTMGELGRRLHLDSGTLSPLVRRMVDAGFVERARSIDDERVVEVRLTSVGRSLRRRAAALPPMVCNAVGLADAARQALVADLRALADRLHTT